MALVVLIVIYLAAFLAPLIAPYAPSEQLDIATSVMPQRYTIPDLVDALVEHFARNPRLGGS